MRHHRILALILGLLVTAVATAAADDKERPSGVPQMNSVSPEQGKAGDVITVQGDYLDRSRLKQLFLTNRAGDLPVEIVEQAEKFVKFKVPAKAAPGRYSLTVLMGGPEPTLLDQPVWLVVK